MNTITMIQSIGFCTVGIAALLGVGYAIMYANNIILRLNRNHTAVVFLNHFADQIERTLRTRKGRERHIGHKFTSTEDDKIIQLIDKYGVENVIFMVPLLPVRSVFGFFSYTTSSDNHSMVPCMIEDNEQYNYKSGYKIRLVSIYDGFGPETMYLSSFTSLIRENRITLLVRKDASAELESLFQDCDSGNYALVRLPSRQAIEHEIQNSKNFVETANALSNLLRRNVVDDQDAFLSCLKFKTDALNVAVKTDRGLLETGTWDKISHSDALDKLNTICRLCNHILADIRDLAGLNVSGEILPEVIEALESIREISGVIHARDDDEVVDQSNKPADPDPDGDEVDIQWKTRIDLEYLGVDGFALALLSNGMVGRDVGAMLGLNKSTVSKIINTRRAGVPEEYYKCAEANALHNLRHRKYSADDVALFEKIFTTWSEGREDWFKFDFEKIAHRCESEAE